MKKSAYALYLVPVLGIPAFLLRTQLYRTALDQRELLIRNSSLTLALMILTGAAAVLTVLISLLLKGSNRYEDNFPASKIACAGSILMALCLGATMLGDRSFEIALLEQVGYILGWASVVCFGWAGIDRARGKQPLWGLHAVTAVFFALNLIMGYKSWSSDPQMQNYLYALLGGICLMLFTYYQTAFCVGMGKRRMQLTTAFFGSFCCLAAAAHGEDILMYLGGAVYLLTNVCRLIPVPEEENEGV